MATVVTIPVGRRSGGRYVLGVFCVISAVVTGLQAAIRVLITLAPSDPCPDNPDCGIGRGTTLLIALACVVGSCMFAAAAKRLLRRPRLQVPPGWPVPPNGWVPPAGWQPEAAWPPVPEGWVWWR